MKIALVRPPALPAYHDTDIKEDPMLSSLYYYLEAIGISSDDIDIFDFQLDKSIVYDSIREKDYAHYVIACRDVGESYRYSLRTARLLAEDTQAQIWLYGQVAPLRSEKSLPKRTQIVIQAEHILAEHMGLSADGPNFKSDLQYKSYFDKIHLEPWQLERKKGVIETTRGCPYRCKFCFINVGESYEKRWQVRPNEAILQDLGNYIDQGITEFVFLDSEFLGKNKKHHAMRRELLQEIIERFPPIKFMILCRADTLDMFADYDLLCRAGLKKVLVGVESLYQPDLDALQKDTTVPTLMRAITDLVNHEVECCLTFLTFHRNTSIAGLKENIANIRKLYQNPKKRYLGMPNFSFNLEVIRDEAQKDSLELFELSENTYLANLIESRGQADKATVCFPTQFETLIELFRILQYEWVVKKCELIRYKVYATAVQKHAIKQWFSELGDFCLDMMSEIIERYEKNKISFASLPRERDILLQHFQEYYKMLPAEWQGIATQEHIDACDYSQVSEMEDHGWDDIIPERLSQPPEQAAC